MAFRTFGEWLRHQRLKKEISPFRMAEDLGYKRVSAIYNFEYGIAPLPLSKWPTLSRVLQIPLTEFLSVMKRYFPEKAAEFRMIQKTAPSRVDRRAEAPETGPEFSFAPTGLVHVDEDEVRTFQVADAEWVLVTQEDWDDSLILSIDRLRRKEGRLKAGLLQVPGSRFPLPGVIRSLKDTRGVCVLETIDKSMLSDRIKAGFIDALTGAEGYPELHRAPKIFSISGIRRVPEWTPPIVLELIKNIKENGGVRHFSLRGQKASAAVDENR
ncbi:MAG TPA: helix-turn-helix transcriptional regulator [Nitrospiria bacterium]